MGKFNSQKQSLWIKELISMKDNINSSLALDSKIKLFEDTVFVFTPKYDLITLKSGATPIDFAYQIHTDIGNTCSGAKVNGKIVPLDYELHSGDILEIFTQKNKKPSESWLEFVKSANAKNHIKSGLKAKEKKLTATEITSSDIKITVEDKMGLLKEISTIFSRNHINIISINTITNARFPVLKFKCDLTTADKIEKFILKLKTIKEIKEISYQLF